MEKIKEKFGCACIYHVCVGNKFKETRLVWRGLEFLSPTKLMFWKSKERNRQPNESSFNCHTEERERGGNNNKWLTNIKFRARAIDFGSVLFRR